MSLLQQLVDSAGGIIGGLAVLLEVHVILQQQQHVSIIVSMVKEGSWTGYQLLPQVSCCSHYTLPYADRKPTRHAPVIHAGALRRFKCIVMDGLHTQACSC